MNTASSRSPGTDASVDSHHVRRSVAIAIGVSLGVSAGIHAFVVDTHLQEWWASGVFFVAAAATQAFSSYAVLKSRSRRGAMTGAVVSLLLIATWLISRTIGVPLGPSAGTSEPVGGIDLFATATEVFAVGAFLVGLRDKRGAGRAESRLSPVVPITIVVLTFGLGTATAAALPQHQHSHDVVPESDRDHLHSTRQNAPLQQPSPTPQSEETEAPHAHDGSRAHHHG